MIRLTSIGMGTNVDKPIDIDSTTFDLDVSGNITLDSTTGINVGTALLVYQFLLDTQLQKQQ